MKKNSTHNAIVSQCLISNSNWLKYVNAVPLGGKPPS